MSQQIFFTFGIYECSQLTQVNLKDYKEHVEIPLSMYNGYHLSVQCLFNHSVYEADLKSVYGDLAHLYHVWFVAHLANLCHIAQLLLDQSALKQDKHDECKERIVPVLVQAPQSNTQHLEHKKWSCGSLFKQLHELWHHHVEPIKDIIQNRAFSQFIPLLNHHRHIISYLIK
jgi:hypothetical protein